MEPSKPPRVFISYSWESEDHKRWVRYLGERLYEAGIEARLDQWFVQPGESFTAFMEQEVEGKASAKAREFEKWRGQNEGDNSAPRMLKNRPAIVPLKTEV